jgi:hypothetical protein
MSNDATDRVVKFYSNRQSFSEEPSDKVIRSEYDLPEGMALVKKIVQIKDPGKYDFKVLPVTPQAQPAKVDSQRLWWIGYISGTIVGSILTKLFFK